jgi:alkylated DNA repair dioxygenase AlkB
MHVSSWPLDTPGLQPIINRIHAVCPTKDIQTHLVHLASHGEILPHIDNIHASGSWILGVSLGADRILCMRHLEDANDTFKLLLPSGSLYIQRQVAYDKMFHTDCSPVHTEAQCDSTTNTLFSGRGYSKVGNSQVVSASV